jgi:hypothetical protein
MGRKRLDPSLRRCVVGLRLPQWVVDKIMEKEKIENMSDLRKFIEQIVVKLVK